MSGEIQAVQETLAVYATEVPETEHVPPGYKWTEVGVIPQDWEVRLLDEAVEFLDSRRRPVKDSHRAKMRGIYPYYGASGIIAYVNGYLFDEELILLGEDGENILSRNRRLAFQVRGKVWVNNHAHVLRPKAGFDTGFLTEYLESLDYDQYNTGTAQPKLNRQVCGHIPVVVPPLHEQRAIAAALSDVDALISYLDRLIAKKDAVKTAATQQLLTGKRRLPGFLGRWYETSLGMIADIVDPHPSHRAPPEMAYGIPFVGIGDISVNGDIDQDTVRLVDESVFDEHSNRYDLNDGLIGIGRVASIGKVVRLLPNIGKFCVSPTIAVIKANSADTGFLFQYLSSRRAKDHFDRVSSGSTRQSVGMTVLRDIQVWLPQSLAEQTAIATVLSDMDAEISALEARREKTRQIKQGMMQELLTGRTRLVPEESFS